MICSSCGTENKPGRRFCVECGSALAVACPSCGAAIEPGEKFCGSCGTPLGATPLGATTTAGTTTPGTTTLATARGAALTEPIHTPDRPRAPGGPAPTTGLPSTAPEPVAERRLVSVLFADLVGFTTLAEGRDAEETRELLSRYFDLARDVIGRYGGTVEKFIGDAVMAVWGAPVAHEDDAERAVRAGLELVDAVRVLDPGIAARAGVLTGEAAVTLGATNQGMVAGDLVNTASRLQSVAPSGTVLVGEATQRAAAAAISFEPAGDQLLKGKAAPVPAWRALRVVAERGGRNRSDTLEAPFVGRDEELRLLKDLFHATIREHRARLVSVIGPAGIGKSRLAWEFLKYVDGLSDPIWWHDGRSPAYGDGISFWALGEMVRARCGLLETDDERTTRSKVAATLAEHIPDEDERRWIEPALLALLGIGSGAATEQLFGAWRTFFERLAIKAPVVLVFEDFHYADVGLIDFVDHVLEWSKNVPLYVLTLSRPQLLERRADWGAGKRNFVSLYLEPLPEPAMRELLVGLVPGLPPRAATAIVARADGIPLYAVETVRMLVAEGRLVLEGGAYRPVGDLSTLAVPETLTALIASRLDALERADRALISDAAVLGQSFTPAGLAAISSVPEAELEQRLRALVKRELLVLDVDPRSPERGQYGFVQALIREVAYGTLARRERKSRHLAAARFFEALGSEELAGALAGHYLAAHASSPDGPEADALAGQARIALRAAAGRAAALGSHEQAVTFLEQALTVAVDPVERADLLELAGVSATSAGHHAAAESFLDRALVHRKEAGDRVATARTTTELARSLLSGRQSERALRILESAVPEFADLAPDPAFVGLEAQFARACFLRDDHRRALEIVERVLSAAERGDLTAILADALVTKGSALSSVGRVREGMGVVEVGERLARAYGLTGTVLRALNNRLVELSDFDPKVNRDVSREALALARRVGDRQWMFQFLALSGFAELLIGEWDEAVALWQTALAEDPEPADRLLPYSSLAMVAAARGEPIPGAADEIRQIALQVTDPQVLWATVDGPATIALAEGRLADAAALWRSGLPDFPSLAPAWLPSAARRAIRVGDAVGARADLAAVNELGLHTPTLEAQGLTIRAGLAALDGRSAEAIRLYAEALRAFNALGIPYEEAQVAIEMATVLDPSIPEVAAAVEAARETLSRLRARAHLDQLEAVVTAWREGGSSVREGDSSAARAGTAERGAGTAPTPEPSLTGDPTTPKSVPLRS
ncbi:MAG: AAA family ATPase [Chloroflexi bacterium]|nr:AAA family ATPase [Chloroflexota bacterium]